MFTPVLAKHTKSFNLVDTLSVGVDRIQRNFEPMQRQVESWRQTQITDAEAKLIFYSAFVDVLHRIWATCLPENPASARVLEKAGVRKEGFLVKKPLKIHGEWRSSFLYAILADEWPETAILPARL